jgi:hypothetical protein
MADATHVEFAEGFWQPSGLATGAVHPAAFVVDPDRTRVLPMPHPFPNGAIKLG